MARIHKSTQRIQFEKEKVLIRWRTAEVLCAITIDKKGGSDMPTAFPVKVRIESTIDNLDSAGLTVGDTERTEEHSDGYLMHSGGVYTLIYSTEGESGRADSEITVSGSSVRVKREGSVSSDFLFCSGEEHKSLYSVGPYKFDVTIKTGRVRLDLDERGGKIDILYSMNIGGADKAVRMKIWMQTS